MSQTLPNTQVSMPVSSSGQVATRDFRHKGLSGWRLIKYSLRYLRFRLLNSWCIWRGALRSFLGHIRSQSARERLSVTLGPSLELSQGRHYQANTRTLARRLYIESVSAIYPWVDIPDLRIFLMGFDAGEQWSLYKADIEIDEQTEDASWLPSAKKLHAILKGPSSASDHASSDGD